MGTAPTIQAQPKANQSMGAPVLDVAWTDDGSKILAAGCDKTLKVWDLGSNQLVQMGTHDAPIKTCHWIKGQNYQCVMTGSWDKTLKFWDLRQQNPIGTLQLPERVFCADVLYPMAVVGTANRQTIIYNLEQTPQEFKRIEPPLKYQTRCVSIFQDKNMKPTGFALGSVEGRVAIQYVNPTSPKDNFTFKCHRSNGTGNDVLKTPAASQGFQDIFPVNDIAFHPMHGTLATVGSDNRYSFWDKDARTKLKTSEQMDNCISRCCFSPRGDLFAYAVSYDWSRGHEFNTPGKPNHIYIHPAFEDLKPRNKK